MPSRRLIPLFALAAFATAGAAHAQKLSVTVGGASDYVFRGVSQTDSKPFVFAALNLSAGQFYAGAGAENVDFGNSIDAEYDLYAGWRPKLANVDLDFGVVRYGYVDQPRNVDIDTVELKASASVPVSGARLGGLAPGHRTIGARAKPGLTSRPTPRRRHWPAGAWAAGSGART